MNLRPWERQPGETAKAFYAFTLYRDLGPLERSITKVSQEYNAERNLRGLMGRWSSKWNWVLRAQAYDDHLDALRRKKTEEELRRMHRRHLRLSMALQSKARAKLKALEGKTMSTRNAIRAISEGIKLERLTRGEPTEKVKGELTTTIQTSGPMPWEAMPEAREAMKIVVKKLREEKGLVKEG